MPFKFQFHVLSALLLSTLLFSHSIYAQTDSIALSKAQIEWAMDQTRVSWKYTHSFKRSIDDLKKEYEKRTAGRDELTRAEFDSWKREKREAKQRKEGHGTYTSHLRGFLKRDLNGDSVLSGAEIGKLKGDADADGKITPKEMIAFARLKARQKALKNYKEPKRLFPLLLDLDKSGGVSEKEWRKVYKTAMRQFDKNKNGILDLDEGYYLRLRHSPSLKRRIKYCNLQVPKGQEFLYIRYKKIDFVRTVHPLADIHRVPSTKPPSEHEVFFIKIEPGPKKLNILLKVPEDRIVYFLGHVKRIAQLTVTNAFGRGHRTIGVLGLEANKVQFRKQCGLGTTYEKDEYNRESYTEKRREKFFLESLYVFGKKIDKYIKVNNPDQATRNLRKTRIQHLPSGKITYENDFPGKKNLKANKKTGWMWGDFLNEFTGLLEIDPKTVVHSKEFSHFKKFDILPDHAEFPHLIEKGYLEPVEIKYRSPLNPADKHKVRGYRIKKHFPLHKLKITAQDHIKFFLPKNVPVPSGPEKPDANGVLKKRMNGINLVFYNVSSSSNCLYSEKTLKKISGKYCMDLPGMKEENQPRGWGKATQKMTVKDRQTRNENFVKAAKTIVRKSCKISPLDEKNKFIFIQVSGGGNALADHYLGPKYFTAAEKRRSRYRRRSRRRTQKKRVNRTQVTDLHIESGAQKLDIVIHQNQPTIFRISGAKGRVNRLILMGPTDAKGKVLAAAQGIDKDRVEFKTIADCTTRPAGRVKTKGYLGNYNYGSSKVRDDFNQVYQAIYGKKVDLYVTDILEYGENHKLKTYGLSSVSLPSGTLSPMDEYKGQGLINAQKQSSEVLWGYLKEKFPGGVVSVDPAQIVTETNLTQYQVLPGRAALPSLIDQGILEPVLYKNGVMTSQSWDIAGRFTEKNYLFNLSETGIQHHVFAGGKKVRHPIIFRIKRNFNLRDLIINTNDQKINHRGFGTYLLPEHVPLPTGRAAVKNICIISEKTWKPMFGKCKFVNLDELKLKIEAEKNRRKAKATTKPKETQKRKKAQKRKLKPKPPVILKKQRKREPAKQKQEMNFDLDGELIE